MSNSHAGQVVDVADPDQVAGAAAALALGRRGRR
jgi:hypothetical protein